VRFAEVHRAGVLGVDQVPGRKINGLTRYRCQHIIIFGYIFFPCIVLKRSLG
jgi:hypothetical protein